MALVLAGPDLDKLVSPSGYPVGSVQKGRSAAALVRLLVNPTGRVVRCDTMATVGNGSLAREVCARARHRSVHPAVGADGSAAWSQATMMASFYAAGLPEADEVAKSGPTPDAELTVSRLPGGADRADVKVVLAVDEQGAALLQQAISRLNLSARAYHRILKVARTIADLATSENIQTTHIAEAVQYRRMDKQS